MSALVFADTARVGTGSDMRGQPLAEVIPFPPRLAMERDRERQVSPSRGANARSLGDISPSKIVLVVRVGLLALATLLLFLGAALLGSFVRPAPYDGPTWVHSVAQGESVWSLAQSIGSSRALEDVVTDIYALNTLDSDVLNPGQQLVLPAR